jgi:site-specific recombinase XerD
VEVGKEGEEITFDGFFGRPWRGREKTPYVLSAPDRACLFSTIPKPEMFSLIWKEKLRAELHSRKYSLKTINAYLYYNRDFCQTVQKQPENINEDDLKKYLTGLNTVKDASSSTMNLALSAIRFFYNQVMNKDFAREQYRPRQDKRLPCILSKDEIEKILETEQNPKHRLLLMMTYSSGLRVSEVVALRKEHVDFDRKTLLVYSAKGRKDRLTLLADRAAAFLKEYCKTFNIENWLFPGQAGAHIKIRTAQNIFEKAARNAGFNKHVSIHSLRHTFATHLLEGGTDIRYIQTLLGHANLRTTERYTHIARRSILRIQSPLDSITDIK